MIATRRSTGLVRIALAAAGAMLVSTARAEPSDLDLHAARELFMSAEADEDAGRWHEALEKLTRVSQIRFTAGVRYHIALCEQALDQLASAVKDYETAEAQARETHAEDVIR